MNASPDPRIDAYIADAEPFAQPLLKWMRAQVHAACPAVEETIKWNMPFFLYRGIFAYMAAFKQHCGFGFWRGLNVVKNSSSSDGMGDFGRIAALSDLPKAEDFQRLVKKAVALRDEPATAKSATPKPKSRQPVAVPAELRAALAKNTRAQAAFAELSPAHRREYIVWVGGAKQAATRIRRATTTVQRLTAAKAKGK